MSLLMYLSQSDHHIIMLLFDYWLYIEYFNQTLESWI